MCLKPVITTWGNWSESDQNSQKSSRYNLFIPVFIRIIDSCNATYFALSQNQLKRLQKLQNTAVRFIFSLKGKDRYQSISPLLKDLHFLPVIYRIRFKVALLTFKCLNNMAPPYLSSMISLRKESSISVRADNDFFLLSQPAEPRCNKTRGAFSYAAPRVWNNLPYSIRANSDVGAFNCPAQEAVNYREC